MIWTAERCLLTATMILKIYYLVVGWYNSLTVSWKWRTTEFPCFTLTFQYSLCNVIFSKQPGHCSILNLYKLQYEFSLVKLALILWEKAKYFLRVLPNQWKGVSVVLSINLTILGMKFNFGFYSICITAKEIKLWPRDYSNNQLFAQKFISKMENSHWR